MNVKLIRRAIVIVPAVLSLTACEWFTDFKRQPSLSTWEPVHCNANLSVCDTTVASRGNPQYSVPVTGTFVAGYQISYAQLPATIDSFSSLQNPTQPTPASIENGHKYFAINCAVCHGDAGHGDGPATKFGMIGINLTLPVTQARTDGYIYGMIRNGRGAMPTYNRIEEMARWDVVNYLRGLQGRLGHPVPIGPLAPPGVTGKFVPGYTETAPTRPAPGMGEPSHGATVPANAGVPTTTSVPTAATAAPVPPHDSTQTRGVRP